MYTEELKLKTIEEFKKYPYYGTVSKKLGISESCIRKWVRNAKLDVEQLKNEIPQIPYIPQSNQQLIDFNVLSSHEMYNQIAVNECEVKEEKNHFNNDEIEFSLNGFNLILKRQYLRILLEELRND